jgi:cytochrome c553
MNRKIRLRHLLYGLAGLAAAALVALWAGLMPVTASSGHWRITAWALHWVMQNSVRTDALFVEPPDEVDDPVLVRRAAGHFDTACRFCHGAPGAPAGPLPFNMTPRPPGLGHAAHAWSPAELFRIVGHGVKFSGMPAWPAPARDDEVWAMVAFLRALPGCVACHGVDGGSHGGAVPVIGGQRADYLAATLTDFRDGRRASGIMQVATAGLDDDMIARLARHYAGRQPEPDPAAPADPAEPARGTAIIADGMPEARVPACSACHGAGGADPKPGIPRLAGQNAGYLATQLQLWRAGTRGGGPRAEVMTRAASGLSDADIRAVAAALARGEE